MKYGLSFEQAMLARPGEIIDLDNCDQISHGAKQKKTIDSFDAFLKLG